MKEKTHWTPQLLRTTEALTPSIHQRSPPPTSLLNPTHHYRLHPTTQASNMEKKVLNTVWTAMKCIHHHPHCNHNEGEHEGTKCLMSDKELEALLAENWRMRNLLEQNIKLLENLFELWTTFFIRRLPCWSNLGFNFCSNSTPFYGFFII